MAPRSDTRHRASPFGGFPKRSRIVRPQKKTVLIVGEGDTEQYYFDGLKRDEAVSRAFAVTIRDAGGGSPEDVVRKAVDFVERAGLENRGYDAVYCVMDVEGLDKKASLSKALTLARSENIRCCLSNPSFEVWLLAHFARTCKSFGNAANVVKELEKFWKTLSSAVYDKNDRDIYRKTVYLIDTALNNSRSVHKQDHREGDVADRDSSTNVYELVSYLLGR
jgi:hypothetical protein